MNIVYFPENRGLAVVLNDLLILCKEANIEYIVRMDADDISVPNRLANQVNYLLLHPEVDVVGGRIEEINEQSHEAKCRTSQVGMPHLMTVNMWHFKR